MDLNVDLDSLADAPEAHYSPSSPDSFVSVEPSRPLPRNDEEDDSESEHVAYKLKKLNLSPDPTENRFFGRSRWVEFVHMRIS